ncbi:MAG TPA: FAD-dependent thymidylate synthase [Mesotoga sp.]|nr:FAD-dependent thymidylate synthase [Mesotoga sp.]MDI9376072.1 FAD-dependent thymidylate synthase [Thermotogota bacterium]NLX33881.1 FAD-dependent thymidylate synthase [Thermotogaceae bacterium]MDD4040318.1 FAD-dependent thymidylate synthase [Mesotoga sp.]MDD4477413.1 FAD-dependent thymidylate synthase [Mesotoga sp.]
MEIKVLDKGFVELVEILGDDYSVVQAARTSYGKGLTTPDRDRKLINYLMERGHHSPFEHVVFKFHIKLPIFVMRQLVRHRIASINERSGRYTQFEEEWFLPDEIRVPDPEDRQKSIPFDDKELNRKALEIMRESMDNSFKAYEELISMGVAREMARIILPISMYTEAYWTINLRSMMNFLNQRADSHAQYEIQKYALAIADILKEKCPISYEAFLKYRYEGDLLVGGVANETV